MADRAHTMVLISPKYGLSRLLGDIKGKSAIQKTRENSVRYERKSICLLA